jgi:uncharacterized protein YndB with AHSA1/START domain
MIALLLFAVVLQGTAPPQAPAPSPVAVTRIATPEKALRFEVTVPGSIDDVWTAFTTTEGLSTWLWRDVRTELRKGGDWIVLYPGGKTGGGTIVDFEPKRFVTMRAMAPEQFPTVRETRTVARFEFEAVSPTSTKVTLIQTGWKEGREWDEAYEYLAGGNATLLTQLHRRFAKGPIAWPKG